MIGRTQADLYHNCIRLITEAEEGSPLFLFKPMCAWSPGKHELKFGLKTISCLGAKDEGALGGIQGKTFDLCYCNEMTLYPESVIQMIISRLSMPHSKLYADMNPVAPSHMIKERMIDAAEKGDPSFYSLHFKVDDNTFLTEEYKNDLRKTSTGLFYRRNYLGEWCLAEGAIFEFFDRKLHIVNIPPRAADFYIAGIDYGASNAFACVLIGYHSGESTQEGPCMWVEKEYYWDPKVMNRQKTNSEYARDLMVFWDQYPIKSVYIDPSAASFKAELQRLGIHCIDADNDVKNGILVMTNLVSEGTLTVCNNCTNLIREIETYSWDSKKAKIGEDAPIKVNDHAIDATRYGIKSFMKNRTTLRQLGKKDTNFRNLTRRDDNVGPGFGWRQWH